MSYQCCSSCRWCLLLLSLVFVVVVVVVAKSLLLLLKYVRSAVLYHSQGTTHPHFFVGMTIPSSKGLMMSSLLPPMTVKFRYFIVRLRTSPVFSHHFKSFGFVGWLVGSLVACFVGSLSLMNI